jgi:hypothetical protein
VECTSKRETKALYKIFMRGLLEILGIFKVYWWIILNGALNSCFWRWELAYD